MQREGYQQLFKMAESSADTCETQNQPESRTFKIETFPVFSIKLLCFVKDFSTENLFTNEKFSSKKILIMALMPRSSYFHKNMKKLNY
jgi:hypothetical protein